MRALLQRVSTASVRSGGETLGSIGAGFLILWCAAQEDAPAGSPEAATAVEKLAGKIARLRVFPDDQGKMNRSLQDIGGEALVVSQFTLYADTARGNRPAFTRAAPPSLAIPLYEMFRAALARELGRPVASGRFGADMQVELVNDGPVTILLDA